MIPAHTKDISIRRRCRTPDFGELLSRKGEQRQLRQLAQEEKSSCAFSSGGNNSGVAGPRSPHPVDIGVGQRIRHFREGAGLTQRQVGAYLGITMQQVQKYECGSNRISAARLSDMARILGRTIPEFFEEEDRPTGRQAAKEIIATMRDMRRADLDMILRALMEIRRMAQ